MASLISLYTLIMFQSLKGIMSGFRFASQALRSVSLSFQSLKGIMSGFRVDLSLENMNKGIVSIPKRDYERFSLRSPTTMTV